MSAEAIIPDLDTEGDRLIASEPNVEETPPARAVRTRAAGVSSDGEPA